MAKTFEPDGRYQPAWPTLPWPAPCVDARRPVYREHPMKTPEAEALATRIESAWSCPNLSGRERRALLRVARKLWWANPSGEEWPALAASIGKLLDDIEARHGVPAPAGGENAPGS
jgi:hypothetical protein